MDFWRGEFSNIIHRMGESLKKIITKEDDYALSACEIRRRMSGIPVYKVCNNSNHNLMIESDHHPDKGHFFYFFSKPDAIDFFEEAKLYHDLPRDLRIFDAPLSDVISYEEEEPMIRLVPESSQIKNATEEKKKDMAAASADNIIITGVPVFKSSKFRLKMTKQGITEKFCPAYLRKEDLQERLTFKGISPDTIEVAVLEEIIHEMKDSSTNKSNDILFIGPGGTSWTWLQEH